VTRILLSGWLLLVNPGCCSLVCCMSFAYSKLETYGSNEAVDGLVNHDYLNLTYGDGENAISEPVDDINEKILLKKQSVKRIFGYPISIPFIIANEFCERFSYYGMRTVLMLYLTEKLLLNKDVATDWYHEFVALCYATPLLGALIADVFLGKFLTIMLLSMVYCTGNAVMAFTAIGKWEAFQANATLHTDLTDDSTYWEYTPHLWGPLVGLHLIALGTGGIKPCVSSFGGDQFLKTESARLQRYFSMFYFSINAGSMVATLLTPEIRTSACMGERTCYPIAFGVPAIFMVVAVGAFVVASKWYVVVPPLGNPIIDVSKVSWAMAFGKESPERLYGVKKVAETKQLFRVLMTFIPFPFFWALFEQQGSRWVVQARRMNGNIGGFDLKPDQMQVFNPVLILCLIPVFEVVVYPTMKKIGLPTSATFRMILGMVIVASSFVICGFIELAMEKRVEAYNTAHQADLLVPYTLDNFPNKEQLHILLTIPQIFVITCGEILCSITGLEFAYAYAPPSMKSVCQSFFLLTNAFGNIIVIIFTKVSDRDVYLYFMWAAIELCAAGLMFFICRRVVGALDAYKNQDAQPVKMSDLETVPAKNERKPSQPFEE